MKHHFENIVLKHPIATLFLTFLCVGFFCLQIPKFKLDASADSLVLENDQSLRYFRNISAKYGSNDFLVLAYTPKQDLFSNASLHTLKNLRDDIRALEGVESVSTILDVPLLFSPRMSIGELDNIRTLEDPDTDRQLAKKEFLSNPLYKEQLLSPDGQTTAILINLPDHPELRELLKRRTDLRLKKYEQDSLSDQEEAELEDVSSQYRSLATKITQQENKNVETIRDVTREYSNQADLFLGGVPMIIADMISFIQNDLIIFGFGVFFFLVITLYIIFRKKRWILLPMICCLAAGLTMLGFLGFMDWRVTVISSNFISLMLIITMSLTIHLIVRYRELCSHMPHADQFTLVSHTVRLKFLPCLYTAMTTIAAFVSLLVSSIRPVMDFGLMMSVGLVVSFVLVFLIFPACLLLIPREAPPTETNKHSSLTLLFAKLTGRHGTKILFFCIGLAVLSYIGIMKLVVENRFIDYFRQSTEIYQGMKLIDQKLGGTTPLDVIIDFKETKAPVAAPADAGDDLLGAFDDANPSGPEANSPPEEDMLNAFDNAPEASSKTTPAAGDDLLNAFSEAPPESRQESTDADAEWFTAYRMEKIEKVHDYLDSLPESGKVLSAATMIKIATRLNDGIPLDNYELTILYKKLPKEIRQLLVAPYVSVDDNQARLNMRVMESDKTLLRQKLLEKIRAHLTGELGFDNEQIHFTNMLVLYNNMLQSLFRSQIMTIGVVFLGIMFMFMILFRSILLAIIAIIPNLLPAAMVLGLMGWLGIPLDMMTITIAAITIGIAVDDTIHYIHRFVKEFEKDQDYQATMHRCHGSIGNAMYYTSLTIIIGFSILVMSNFIPTVYFGLFTGFGMLAALLAALTLLPQLLLLIKPLGPGKSH